MIVSPVTFKLPSIDVAPRVVGPALSVDPTSSLPTVLSVPVLICPLLTKLEVVVFPATVSPDWTLATPEVLSVED